MIALALPLALGCPAPDPPPQFHLMQIEQVTGGVDGDVSAQAIQLRMRVNGQDVVEQARLRAWDADGQLITSVLLLNFQTNVANSGEGVRILIASNGFTDYLDGHLAPDFVLDELVPAGFLAAGSITFEDDANTVYWRLAWGGAGYTGSTSGAPFNDLDGEFGPPVDDALPSCGVYALRFQGPAAAFSTANLKDYAATAGPSTWVNNAGESAVLAGRGAGCSCLADTNGDMEVDVLDLIAVIAAWGSTDPDTDTNGDGAVDVGDLVAIIVGWGPCPTD